MKTLFITSDFYPRVGGGENYVLNLGKELVKLGCNITVLCPNELDSGNKTYLGLNIKYSEYRKILGNKVVKFKIIINEIKSGNYDLVYVSGPGIVDIFSVIISKVYKKKIFTTYHADLNMSKITSRIFMYIYCKLILPLFSKIIITTQVYYDILIKRGVNKKLLSMIPVGFETNSNIDIDETINEKEKNSILYVGALDTEHLYKNLQVLLDTAKNIPNYKIKIVGGGNLKNQFEDYVNKNEIKNIKFYGKVSNEELNDLYEKSKIFILPSNSKQEGFGIVLLEAISRGCLVITGELSGGSTLIRENKNLGSLYNGSADDLIKSIKKCESIKIDKEAINKISKSYERGSITNRIYKDVQTFI